MTTLSTGTDANAGTRGSRVDVERELKFTIPSGRIDLARRWLDALCRRDWDHPAAYVWTIYYDTPHLGSLGEKINSDYLKSKIRLRWYSEPSRPPAGPAFIEAKLRVGAHRDKVRVQVNHDAEDLASWDLRDVRLQALPLLLRTRGVPLQEPLRPLLEIRYRRDRFVEPTGNARVSLDSEIAAVAVNRSSISTHDSTPLGVGILEAKGGSEDLPPALRGLLSLGARKRSFSKLLAVYTHVTRTKL